MYDAEDVLQAGRAIYPHLPDLAEAQAEEMGNRLIRLLDQAAAGDDVKLQILALFSETSATRDWANKLLSIPEQYRSYQRMAGGVQGITVPRYGCPHGDYSWYRFNKGDQPPLCPHHKVALVYEGS